MFVRLIFGLNCSPFLLNATLRYHLSKFAQYDAEFVKQLLSDFYVDDLVRGAKNTDAAFLLYEKAMQRMVSGGFRLHKWKTNDKQL